MKKWFGVIAVSMVLFSCSTLKVATDMDKTVDFSTHKSLEFYGWEEKSDSILNRFDRDRIENAFGEEFKKRGFTLAEKGQADIIVSLYIVTEDKVQKTATTDHVGGMGGYGGYGRYYGYGPGYGYGSGYSYTTVNEYNYTVGTLVISVFDAKKKELIWEAVGSAEVEENPQKRDKTLPKIIARVMRDYPVAPVK